MQISRDELAEDVAATKSFLPLRGAIASYRMVIHESFVLQYKPCIMATYAPSAHLHLVV